MGLEGQMGWGKKTCIMTFALALALKLQYCIVYVRDAERSID